MKIVKEVKTVKEVKIEIINKCNAVNYIFSGVSGQYI